MLYRNLHCFLSAVKAYYLVLKVVAVMKNNKAMKVLKSFEKSFSESSCIITEEIYQHVTMMEEINISMRMYDYCIDRMTKIHMTMLSQVLKIDSINLTLSCTLLCRICYK